MHFNGCFKHPIRPGVNADRPNRGFPVEAADVTVRLVKAHQAVDLGDTSNAPSIAVFIADVVAPVTSISTKVPSSGLARRILSEAVAIGCQQSLHTLGDMRRRQGCASDIPNIAIDLERTAAGLSNKLREPARASDLAPIGLPILQDLDAVDGAAGCQATRSRYRGVFQSRDQR